MNVQTGADDPVQTKAMNEYVPALGDR